jgi:hypothetical protein
MRNNRQLDRSGINHGDDLRRMSDRVGLMSLATRSIPMRFASRTSVELNSAYSEMSTFSPPRFGQHSPAGKPANELHPGLATTIGAALVDRDLGDEVAITPGDRQPLIYVGQDLLAVRDAAPIPCHFSRTKNGRFGDVPGGIHAVLAIFCDGIGVGVH